MEYIDASLIITILKSVLSYFFLYKIMELKINKKSKRQTLIFLLFLLILFIGNLAVFVLFHGKMSLGLLDTIQIL